jgi:hypothetical protein
MPALQENSRRIFNRTGRPTHPSRPVSFPASHPVTVHEEESIAIDAPNPLDVDWGTLLLGLLALLAIGGLIPLFTMVYYAYFPVFP